jgi:L-tyrosine isonitrile synthase
MTADSVGSALSPDQTVLKPTLSNRFPGTHSPAERRFPQQPVSPERVLRSFNTRSFKRERPDHPELMLKIISGAIGLQQPVPFVLYWGKGFRDALADPELQCLDFLASMRSRIAETYKPGTKITLVFTDTHAALNGHSSAGIEAYFGDLERAARQRGFAICRLGALVEQAPPDLEQPADTDLPQGLLAQLVISAAKWFRGSGSPEEGAIRYYRANMIERQVLERAFPRSIFITFNGSELRPLFPERMPIFYMYSIRHGVSDKPWFLPSDYASAKRLPKVTHLVPAN